MKRLFNNILEFLWVCLLDDCEICRGESGGIRGNEQIVDGKVMCDYCSVDYRKTNLVDEETS